MLVRLYRAYPFDLSEVPFVLCIRRNRSQRHGFLVEFASPVRIHYVRVELFQLKKSDKVGYCCLRFMSRAARLLRKRISSRDFAYLSRAEYSV